MASLVGTLKEKFAGMPRTSRRILVIGVLSFIGVIILFRMFFVYVRPWESGIKQVNVGFRPGIQAKVYGTGFQFVAPFGFHVMHRFPRNLQLFEMNNYTESASSNASSAKAAHIQTSDGFYVDVDVSILYRISDPYKTITTIGAGMLYETNGLIPKAEPKLKEALGELTTEEFFNSPLRVEKANKARDLMNQELMPMGITVDSVLVRYFKYSDEIQRNIEEKKLKDQLVFTNQSKARASTEEALVTKVRTEGEANVKVKLEEGKAYVVKRQAEMDLYVRTKHAQADLLVKLAEARKTELVNASYQLRGSDKLVGLEMAKVYQGLKLIMLPSSGAGGINPLDLQKSLQLFGVR